MLCLQFHSVSHSTKSSRWSYTTRYICIFNCLVIWVFNPTIFFQLYTMIQNRSADRITETHGYCRLQCLQYVCIDKGKSKLTLLRIHFLNHMWGALLYPEHEEGIFDLTLFLEALIAANSTIVLIYTSENQTADCFKIHCVQLFMYVQVTWSYE